MLNHLLLEQTVLALLPLEQVHAARVVQKVLHFPCLVHCYFFYCSWLPNKFSK